MEFNVIDSLGQFTQGFIRAYQGWTFSGAWEQLKGSVKEPNMFHSYEIEKITRKDSDAADTMQLYRVVWFFRPRSSCTTHVIL